MNLLKIFFLEIRRLFVEEKYLILTIFLPSILIFLIFIPYNILIQESPQKKIIGIVELDSIQIFDILEHVVYQNVLEKQSSVNYELIKIKFTGNKNLDSLDNVITSYQLQWDSLQSKLENIRAYREKLFLNKRMRKSTKKRLLKNSFQTMQNIKNKEEQVDSILTIVKQERDSLYENLVKHYSDSLLKNRAIDMYIVFSDSSLKKGLVEYHTYSAGEFLETEILDKSITSALQQIKLIKLNLPKEEIQTIISPLQKQEYWIVQQRKETFNIVGGYVLPVFVAILTAISLILSTEAFFLRILKDKAQKYYELFFYKWSLVSLWFIRILSGLVVGLIQISIWILMVYISFRLQIITVEEFFLAQSQNLIFYFVEYSIAYLSLSLLYLLFYPFINVKQERYSFILQLFRVILFIPIIFAFVFIRNLYPPLNSLVAYIPFYLPVLHVIFIDFLSILGRNKILANFVILGIQIVLVILLQLRLKSMRYEWYLQNFKIKEVIRFPVFKKLLKFNWGKRNSDKI